MSTVRLWCWFCRLDRGYDGGFTIFLRINDIESLVDQRLNRYLYPVNAEATSLSLCETNLVRSNVIFDLVLDALDDIFPRDGREIGAVKDSVN